MSPTLGCHDVPDPVSASVAVQYLAGSELVNWPVFFQRVEHGLPGRGVGTGRSMVGLVIQWHLRLVSGWRTGVPRVPFETSALGSWVFEAWWIARAEPQADAGVVRRRAGASAKVPALTPSPSPTGGA